MGKEDINLRNGVLSARVYKGQLVGLGFEGRRYFHGGGLPDHLKSDADRKGWGNSEIAMFPIVGKAAGNKVVIQNTEHYMDQHGIARVLPFEGESWPEGGSQFRLVQEYDGKSPIENPKFTGDQEKHPEDMSWPHQYRLVKEILLNNGPIMGVNFRLQNRSEDSPMPYMFGWHPAFKVQGKVRNGVFVLDEGEEISLEEVIRISGSDEGAVKREGVQKVTYVDSQYEKGVNVQSDLGSVMLWSPGVDSGMFCIEPVTQLPAPEGEKNYFSGENHLVIEPRDGKEHSVTIEPF